MVDGYLYRPPGAGPFPAVIGFHGCSGLLNKQGAPLGIYRLWAQHLRDQGYVVLLVDGFTPREVTTVCGRPNAAVSPQDARPRDAYGALRYLSALSYVRVDRVAVMGWSHGGGTVLYTVSPGQDAQPAGLRFRAAVALYPGWYRAGAHAFGWTPSVPLLVLLGEKDDWTPSPSCYDLMERARAHGGAVELELYPDAHHGFDSPAPPRALSHVRLPGGASPTAGGNPAARTAAYARVLEFLDRMLKD
jgi:dienelactone hydrolase